MKKYDIFISYRRSDGYHIAEMLFQVLSSQGFSVFFDKTEMRVGFFPDEIKQAISMAQEMICLVSPDYFGISDKNNRIMQRNDWVKRELEIGLKNRRDREMNIFPILFECEPPKKEQLPRTIQSITRMHFFKYDKNYDTAEKLVERLRLDFAWETLENALVGSIRKKVQNIDINDPIFNDACKSIILMIKSPEDVKALTRIIEQSGEYDQKSRYATFYVLFSYFRRMHQVRQLLALINEYGEEFSGLNDFFLFVKVEYYTQIAKLERNNEKRKEYLINAVYYAKQSMIVAPKNNGMVHSFCLAVARAMEGQANIPDKEVQIALSAVNRIIQTNPDYARYYSTRARLLAILGKYEEALFDIQVAQTIETPLHDDWGLRVAGYYRDECKIRIALAKIELMKKEP